jgi:hypothetical protein
MTTGDIGEAKPAYIPEVEAELAKYGIRRVPADYFFYGQYRYTNPTDAIA